MSLKSKIQKDLKVKPLDLRTVNQKQSLWKILMLIAPALVVVITFTIIPFIAASTDAFQDVVSKSDPTTRVASGNQFVTLFKDPAFHNALYNSFLYALISVPLIIVISLLISSAISTTIRKYLRGFWQTLFFLPYVTSAVAIGLSFAYIFDADTGILNKIIGKKVPWLQDPNGHSALGAMLIYGVWRGIAFNTLIFTSAMLSVNKSLYKSSALDGAGPIKQFFSITLPSIRRTVNFLLTIGVIGAIKVFPLALFKNNPEDALSNNGSTLLIYVFAKLQVNHNYMLAGAASVMLVVISIAFSTLIRSTVDLSVYSVNKLKEVQIENKIKNTKQIFKMKKR